MRTPARTRVAPVLLLALCLFPILGLAGQAPKTTSALPEFRLLEPDWRLVGDAAATPALKKLWQASLALLRSDSAGRFSLRTFDPEKGQPPAGSPFVRAMITGSPGAWSAILQLDPQAAGAMKYLSFPEILPGTYLELTRALEAMELFLEPPSAPASATLVDSFSLSDLIGADLPSWSQASLGVYGLGARRDGTLVAACGSTVLEFDQRWQVTGLPTKRLNEEGNNLHAYSMAMTPAGTLLVRSADGASIWTFPEGSADYSRLRLESPAGSVFGVMEDGSPFVVSMNPKLARITRGGRSIDLPLAADSAVLAASSGPEDTLWLSDLTRGSIRVHGSDGRLRDIIYPELPQGSTIMRLRVLPSGDFLAATASEIRRFDAKGRLRWVWSGADAGLALNFSMYTDMVPGPGGTIYVNDLLGKRILRLAEPGATLSPQLARVARAQAALRSDPSRAEVLLPLAEAYESMGAAEAARAVLVRYLEERPADAKAADRRWRLEADLLKAKATSAEADVAVLLRRFGPETARDAYGRAMRTLEEIHARLPDDAAVTARIARLRGLFRDSEGGQAASSLPLPQVAGVELAALFPSLLQAYRARPAGAVLLRNTTGETLREVRAEIFIQKYMDFPSAGKTVASLAAGAELRLEISPLLNERVLEVQEDLPLQALITVRFSDSHGARSIEVARPIVLYKKSAITWDDTGKIAGFITPNEESISRATFALLQTLPERPLLSTPFGRAMALCDALGALPLRYVPDPQSPVSSILGNTTLVDTVRFPRTTLAYQGGDCDDTTALLASVLESAGIGTAILTTPGHIFLAFDSGERAEGAWIFESPGYETVMGGSTAWIPIETTVLAKGFAQAWKSASELVHAHRGKPGFEFLPLLGLRSTYPALPLPPSSLPVPGPDPELRLALDRAVLASLNDEVYLPTSASLDRARGGAQGAEWNRQTNRLAQLHARWNQLDRARTLWNDILKRDPNYIPAYLNLATANLQAKKKDEAVALLKRAEGRAPGSPVLVAWAARSGLSSFLAGGAAPGQTQAGGTAEGPAIAAGGEGSQAPGGARAASGSPDPLWLGD